MILIIIACANAFGWLLAVERIPNIMIDFITQLNVSPLVVLLLINAVLLFLGCFIEGIAILVILTPVLLPIVMQLGYNPVYFGVLAVLNVMIGVVTPPMGMSLFITSRITNISVMKLSKAMLPFYVALLGTLLLCIFSPDIILFIPNLLFK
jgi:C4-dicarboxylate transporter DctM subunit